MRNYLLRLGWSHGDDEIISDQQALEWFDLKHIGQSAGRFDFAKLESLNAHYIKAADNTRLLDLTIPFIEKKFELTATDLGKQRLLAGMEELKSRAKTLLQIADEGSFYVKTIPYSFDEKARTNLDSAALLVLKEKLNLLADFTAANIEAACKDVAATLTEGKLGKVAMPLRAALTGTTVSPSIFHAAEILGKEETVKRLSFAIQSL